MNTVKYSCYWSPDLTQEENDFIWATLRIHDRFTLKHQISDGIAVFTWCFNSLQRGHTTCLGLTSKTKVLITPKVCCRWEGTDERCKRIIWKAPYCFHITALLNKKSTISLLSRSTFSTMHFCSNICVVTLQFNLRYRLHKEHISLAYFLGHSKTCLGVTSIYRYY